MDRLRYVWHLERRYAIVDEALPKEGAAKLHTVHEAQAPLAVFRPPFTGHGAQERGEGRERRGQHRRAQHNRERTRDSDWDCERHPRSQACQVNRAEHLR
jgi:hypothetical protein